ncbi:MAG: PRC-barrel domain-containing protein [Candidatus Thorarchaeota archaeon]|jgi:sporulation protein YlmC with PRC-barrel domain
MNGKEIRNCDVVDSSGEKVGRINDMTFKFDGTLKLSQFILAGSRWEEFLESVKIKPDKDPLLDASLIRMIGDTVQLSTNVNSLKTTLDKGAIEIDEIRWSDLTKMDIFDKDDVKVGRAVDVDFDTDGTACLIVGGGLVEESLEAVGLKADVDVLVPSGHVTAIRGKIVLDVSKDDLQLTMDKALEKPEVKKARERTTDERAAFRVRLF